ncbi:MAG: tetratricopeptide repeat protein [Thermoguttaceae bacterium]
MRRNSPTWPPLLVVGILAWATVAVYSNSFRGPLIFDDKASIADNASIRQIAAFWQPLCPPAHGETVTGRPVLNLSLAFNYSISGLGVWSYHATNLAIHLAATLLLFGLVRRTLTLPTMSDALASAAMPIAFATALLWAVHPLQTESVTYIVQRAESLAGLFYLLTLYGLLRGATSPEPRNWYVVASLACLFGMGTKEVMVSAPLIALLYDRTFLAGSFGEAVRQRRRFYLALAASWLLLAALVIGSGGRAGTAGFGSATSCWAYLGTQFGAIVHYLRLTVWPSPLVLDYGTALAKTTADILPNAVAIGLLGLATLVALWRWPKVGFLGVCFFALLAPTSSIVPIATQTVAEHRMYLPLAAVVAALTLGGYALCLAVAGARSATTVLVSCAVVTAAALGVVTFQRNNDYRSELSIWEDTVAKVPNNPRAMNDLGNALLFADLRDEAIVQFQNALAIEPRDAEICNNLGRALARSGRLDDAILQYRKAIALNPKLAGAYNNLGNAEMARNRVQEGKANYLKALELRPDYAEAHLNLGMVLGSLNQFKEAAKHLQRAIELQPEDAKTHSNYGIFLAACGQPEDAILEFRRAVELRPDFVDARSNLGAALVTGGRLDEAVTEFRAALALQPNSVRSETNLGRALVLSGKAQEGVTHLRRALRIQPDSPEAMNHVAWLLATCPEASVRDGLEAVRLAERADQLTGGKVAEVLRTLAAAYAEQGRFPDALAKAQKAWNIATAAKRETLARAIRAEMTLYRAGKPCRQSSSPAPSTPPKSPR